MINDRGSKWKTLSSKIVYKNPWIEVQEDQVIQPGGREGVYGFVKKPPGVFIIAEDKDGSIFFIREYRYVLKKAIIQLPSGVVDEKYSAIENAKRELLEETGIKAGKFTQLGKYFVAPGHETTFQYAVLATDLDTSKLKIHQEGDESIEEILKFPRDKVREMIRNNEIECGLSLAALSMYLQNIL
jgi:8-oxo-dGTP pyrophosphatase MutT (NUDIX family)